MNSIMKPCKQLLSLPCLSYELLMLKPSSIRLSSVTVVVPRSISNSVSVSQSQSQRTRVRGRGQLNFNHIVKLNLERHGFGVSFFCTTSDSGSFGSTPPPPKEKEERKQRHMKIEQDAPINITADCIGPPDPISNIPRVQFYSPPDETETEKEYRLQRMGVIEWNHKFWSAHNESFFKEKNEYVKNHKKDQGGGKKKMNAEEMAIFYRNFLNENRNDHLRYNKEWYKKNFKLLWPAFKVACIRLGRKVSKKNTEESK